jgi:hypothetical protein
MLQFHQTDLFTDTTINMNRHASVCVLTLHAMLHIPDDILNAGPMWCYWNYITERYVGYLVRSSKSRRNPYASFARRLREIAQNSVIKFKYRLHSELDLSNKHEEESVGHTPHNCECIPHILNRINSFRSWNMCPQTPSTRWTCSCHSEGYREVFPAYF